MHPSCLAWCEEVLGGLDLADADVLEAGSYDYNGSVRQFVKSRSYLGIDVQDGPGVDQVCDIGDLSGRSFDLVISTEMLEHVQDWRPAVNGLKRATKVGGLLLITTRSAGFPYHPYPIDSWRYELADMQAIFADFDVLRLDADTPPDYGVLLLARRRQRRLLDLRPIRVSPMTPNGVVGAGAGMQQANGSGWYATPDGGEVFVPNGIVRPDNHPDVKALPSLFVRLVDELTVDDDAKPTRGRRG